MDRRSLKLNLNFAGEADEIVIEKVTGNRSGS